MEDNDTKKADNNEKMEDGINVSPVDVHMFDFDTQDFLNKVMTSNIVRGAGAFVSLLLAFIFGAMFLIGGIGLVKGKNSGESAVETAAVEGTEEGEVETSESETEEENVGAEEE